MELIEITLRVPVADARKILEYVASLHAVREPRKPKKEPEYIYPDDLPF